MGTSGDDTITGSGHNDYIFGQNGNNHLIGGGGDDFLRGGTATDHLEGGVGDDRLEGGSGNDLLDGGAGRDDLHGGAGIDTLLGGAGDDRLEGDAGADIMDGGLGTNQIAYLDSTSAVYVNLASGKAFGGYAEGDVFSHISNIDASNHDDVLIGNSADNVINGELGDDFIRGGAGNDHLFGGGGNDQIYGEDGNDIFDGFSGAEFMDGGAGTDTVEYLHPYNEGGVYVNLATGEGHWNAAEGDNFVSIENAIGTNDDDVLIGDSGNNYLIGLKGNDVIYGGSGDDVLESGGGTDWLIGAGGHDKFIITPDATGTVYVKDFNPAEDVLDYSGFTSSITSWAEIVLAQVGNDTLVTIEAKYFVFLKDIAPSQLSVANFVVASTALNTISTASHVNGGLAQVGDGYDNYLVGTIDGDNINGAAGADTIAGFEGNDILNGGDGDDVLGGGDGADVMNGGNGTDIIDYTDSYEGVTINLSTGSVSGGIATGDTFSSIENVRGSNFNDTITGNNAVNVLYGFAGDDILKGGGGADILEGGAGADTFAITVDPNVISQINDFDLSNPNEKIDLSAFGTLSSLQIVANNNAGYVTVKLSNGQNINLINIATTDASKITQDKFIFSGTRPTISYEIQGGAQSNILVGSDGNDTIYTLSGSNLVIDGKGNDNIHFSDGTYTIYHVTRNVGDQDTVFNYVSLKQTLYKYTTQEVVSNSGSPFGFKHFTKDTVDSAHIIDNQSTLYGVLDLTEFADVRSLNDLTIQYNSNNTKITMQDGQTVTLNNFYGVNNGAFTTQPTTGFTYYRWDRLTLDSSNFNFYTGTLEGDRSGDNINDTLQGGSGADNIKGYGGNDTLDGGKGNDILDGGAGNDVLTGGDGTDTFIIGKESGATDTITDFEFWRIGERIDLSAFNSQFVNFTAFKNSLTQSGSNVVINLGSGQTIVLQNTKVDYLTHDNFIGNSSINTAPIAIGTINSGSDVVSPESPLNFKVPGNVFTDSDGDVLIYTATLANGSSLPSWISFDATTRTFSGTPTASDIGQYNIRVIASDGSASANKDFTINATSDLPALPVTITTIAGSAIAGNEVLYLSSAAISLQKIDQNLKASPIIQTMDGQTVSPDSISSQRMTLTDSSEVIVTFKNSVAGFSNALGWYIVEQDGTITNPKLIFGNAHQINEGNSYNLGNIAAGTQIGFFMAADGGAGTWASSGQANIAMGALDLVNGTFGIVDSSGNAANIYTNTPPTLVYSLNGADYVLNKNVYLSSNNADLNPDHIIHSGAGWDSETNSLQVGFEDLLGGGDHDYNDILFNVDLGTSNNAVKYAGVSLLAGNLFIAPQTGVNINSADINVSGTKTGDTIIFEGHNITDGIIDGTNVHVTTTSLNDTLTLNMSNFASSAQADELLHSIKLVNVGGDSTGTRDINFTLHNSTGSDISAVFHIAVSGSPVNGTTAGDILSGTSENDNIFGYSGNDTINAGASNDIIHGGLGADLLAGASGWDNFNYDNLLDSTGSSYDTINDFTQGQDKIDMVALHTFGISSFTDLHIVDNTVNNETIITAYDTVHAGATEHFELHLKDIINLNQQDFVWA